MLATIKKSKDHSIWMKHITDPSGNVLPVLAEVIPAQDVVLRLAGREGVWTRFKGTDSTGFKCKDSNAKSIWDGIAVDSSVSIEIVRVVPISENASGQSSVIRKNRISRDRTESKLPRLQRLDYKIQGNVLAIGVDVAWWGGAAASPKSRCETIAFASRIDDEWSEVRIRSIDLNESFVRDADEWTPNADPDAKLLCLALNDIINEFSTPIRVVVSLDVPILALDRDLPPRKKANRKDESGLVEYRGCDLAWMNVRKNSPRGWNGVNILPGAPIAPRCTSLLAILRAQGFEVFGLCDNDQQRLLIECFPNEIVWSMGVTGLDCDLSPHSLQQYKRLGKKKLPLGADLFHSTWRRTIRNSFKLAEIEDVVLEKWINDIEIWIENSAIFNKQKQIGYTGKVFDDSIESVLSMTAAVALVNGKAHVHIGTDPKDGHIIGPGLSRE